jgi:UDPglucose 6-dehydrogenase
MKIAIVGTGYVGLSNACMLAQQHEVVLLDIVKERVNTINERISPITDIDIQEFLDNSKINLYATLRKEEAYFEAKYVIVATPTNYDPKKNKFDTSIVEKVIKDIKKINSNATIIIKSTVPIGFTEKIKEKLNYKKIIFCPEFLREGKALHDNLYPSRILIGDISDEAKEYASILVKCIHKEKVSIVFMGSREAEAAKLFSNAYLAMRVAFFNELDTFAIGNNLKTKEIIDGVSLDDRIGLHYKNPSFGYGGYCLPKDTKQLLNDYKSIPQKIIKAIVESNETRIKFIAAEIIKKNPNTIGVYRLQMKAGSDNFREASIEKVIKRISNSRIKIIIYEPNLKSDYNLKYEIINELDDFKKKSDVIIANRIDAVLSDVDYKVYTRDVYSTDN